jgi:hypothetical protein
VSDREHLTEDDLVLHHYGETGAPAGAALHLNQCESCRVSYETLRSLLETVEEMPVPERGEDYGAEVWRRLRPGLARPEDRQSAWWGWNAWVAPRRWALAAALLVMLGAGFLAGRWWQPPQTSSIASAGEIPAPVRERILLVAVGDHLERSQMMLVELINSEHADEPSVDMTSRQKRADDLVTANRIYRRTAAASGDAALAAVLDELERVLLDIARGPSQLTAQELEQVRKRIEQQGILFKVRVVGSQVREREKAPTPAKPVAGRT